MYHILICDDEQDIVNALKIYLMNPDFKLFEANTGVQALEVMEREDIHLILLDIMMPEMDGISAMVKIREKSNVPIILLTAKSEDTDKILGLNTGAAICSWAAELRLRHDMSSAAWNWMTAPRKSPWTENPFP